MKRRDLLLEKTTAYNRGDARRIQHFWKVWAYAALIGRREGLNKREREILEAAAIVHDVGIREAERKYNSSAGPLQEREGPPVARTLLRAAGYDEEAVARVAYLVGRHHTYDRIDGADYQILVEADFLVNLYEDGCSLAAIDAARARIFKTASGRALLEEMFAHPDGEGERAGFCPRCAKERPGGDRFCRQCGGVLTRSDKDAAGETQTAETGEASVQTERAPEGPAGLDADGRCEPMV